MAITTNRDYLKASLIRFGLTDADIDLIIADNPVLDDSFDVQKCKLSMYNSMSSILPVANVSEGGYSISWNIDGLKLWYRSLCNELGKPNVLNPQIKNRSNYW